MPAHSSHEPPEGDDLLLVDDVLEVGGGAVQGHLLDGLSGLAGVLKHEKGTQLAHPDTHPSLPCERDLDARNFSERFAGRPQPALLPFQCICVMFPLDRGERGLRRHWILPGRLTRNSAPITLKETLRLEPRALADLVALSGSAA